MIEELNVTRQQFQSALERYVTLCSGIHNATSLRNIPREDALREIDSEIALLASYESKLHEARRTIGEARNYSLNLTQINTIPSEILLHIFQLLTSAEPCLLRESTRHSTRKPFIRYPDTLVRVCSRWRQIATSSPSLWVHFDLPLCKTFPQLKALIERVETRAMRSAKLPVQIHIVEPETPTWLYSSESYLKDIARPVISRSKDLEFNIGGDLEDFHNSVLKVFLTNCTPQMFNKLTINSTHGRYNNFIGSDRETIHAEEGVSYLRLNLPSDEIEAGLSHLNVLHLSGFFPKWTSVAYHGLVDLRLTSPDSVFWSWIKASELANILRASPALRILILELEITELQSDHTLISPVSLVDLEVLDLTIDNFWAREEEDPPAHVGKLLRLISPGSKPLRLTLQTFLYSYNYAFDDIRDFFMRSNIVKFCAQDAYPPLYELISYAPNLKILVFRGCVYRQPNMALITEPNQGATASLGFHWDSWHIRYCEILVDDLSKIVKLYPTGEIILTGSTVLRKLPEYLEPEDEYVPEVIKDVVPTEQLSIMFPSVRFIGEQDSHDLPNPTADWDVLD